MAEIVQWHDDLLQRLRRRRGGPSGRAKYSPRRPRRRDRTAVVTDSSAALPRVVAVVRPGDDRVAALLGSLGCEVKVCADADTGMAASLVHAISYTKGAPGWVVALGDMPYVQPSTIALLSETVEQGARIAAPTYRGQRGNPVAFSPYYLDLLLALDGDQGARSILKSHTVTELVVDDAGILQDFDTQADL